MKRKSVRPNEAMRKKLERRVQLRRWRVRRNDYLRAMDRLRTEGHKLRGIMRLGGACAACGLTITDVSGHVECFDFHHLDPDTKCFAIAGAYGRSWNALKVEIDKCELLCAVCHRVVTADDPPRNAGRPRMDGTRAKRPRGRRIGQRAGQRRNLSALRAKLRIRWHIGKSVAPERYVEQLELELSA